MAKEVYRYRRCRHCGATFPGGQLKPLRYGEGHYHKRGGSLRRCPNCGHSVVVNGLGRKRLNIPLKIVCECLKEHRSVGAAANELGC